MPHLYRWHSRLTAGLEGPMVGKHALHLRQSDLDGACGTHCALMALMLFGEVSRDDLEGRPKKALASFWKAARPYYFAGAKPNKLVSFFKPYDDTVTSRVIAKRLPDEIRSTILADGLAIIGIQNAFIDHWTLAVGIGGREGFPTEEKLLLLDSDLPPMPLMPWNATLSLDRNRSGWHRYDSQLGTIKVRLSDAVCLDHMVEEMEVDRV